MNEHLTALMAAGALLVAPVQLVRALIPQKWGLPSFTYALLHMAGSVAYCLWVLHIPWGALVQPVLEAWGTGAFTFLTTKAAVKAVRAVGDRVLPEPGDGEDW